MLSLSKHCPCSSGLAHNREKEEQSFDKLRTDGFWRQAMKYEDFADQMASIAEACG
jgi:hypothetical protein